MYFEYMFSNIIINIIISIIIIISIHYLWEYLKSSMTVYKTKDLVNSQIEKYKKIVDELQSEKTKNIQGSQTSSFLSKKECKIMKEELLDFVNTTTGNIQ